MQAPELPEDEPLRLQTLQALNVLDTESEERFDRLTRMARRVFGTPIALVSLVDADRQWFKSALGLDARETPRDISFCGHAIIGNDIFVVPDASSDLRFADNPLVTGEPNIRFYAGCPLRAANGAKVGTLCVIDRQPRAFDEDDYDAMRDLAAMAEREIAAIQLATVDELTGISNRRGFLMVARHALALCRRQQLRALLVYIDLDDFKPINDEHGHAEGDSALQLFAAEMQSVFRASDAFGRMGGDEFAVLMTNTTVELAEDVMRRFEASLAAQSRELQLPYTLTFSYGMVAYDPHHHDSIEDLLHACDTIMYQRKRQRRLLAEDDG